ncbi:MAG: hypothetical protein M3N33_13160 [Actinomycetota bacterium]|nr:hypothetical protein [Actinomycetota bacterium]
MAAATPELVAAVAHRLGQVVPIGEGVGVDVVDRRVLEQQLDAGCAYRGTVVGECLAELVGSSSTWGRHHVVQQVARRAPAGLVGADARRWVEQVADDVLAHPRGSPGRSHSRGA